MESWPDRSVLAADLPLLRRLEVDLPAARLMLCRIGLAVFMVTMVAAKSGAREISLATSPIYGPYTAIVEGWFRNAGLTAVTRIYPQERAVYLAEKGEVDGVFFRTKEAFANRDNLRFIGPVGCADVSAFFLKGHNIEIAAADDLRRYRVAIRLGDKLAEALLSRTATMSTIVLEDVDLLKLLEAERVDIVLLPRARGVLAAEKSNMRDQIEAPVIISTSPLYLVLVNAEKETEKKLSEALIDMKNSGELARQAGDINQNMGLPRWFGLECPVE